MSFIDTVKKLFLPSLPAPTSGDFISTLPEAPISQATAFPTEDLAHNLQKVSVSNIVNFLTAQPNDLLPVIINGVAYYQDKTTASVTQAIVSPLNATATDWTIALALTGFTTGDNVLVRIDSGNIIFAGRYITGTPNLISSVFFDRVRFKTFSPSTSYTATFYKLSTATSPAPPNVLYKVETNYGGGVVLANSGGNILLGAGGAGQRQLEANTFEFYQSPVADNVATSASTVIGGITVFVGTTPVYITATSGNLYTRLTPVASTYTGSNTASDFGGTSIQSISYSGSGAFFWVITAVTNNFKLAKVQANANGTLSLVAITGTAFLIVGNSTAYISSILNFTVSTGIGANDIVAMAGIGTGADGNYLYIKNYSITGSNITITENQTPKLFITASQLLDVVGAIITTDDDEEVEVKEGEVRVSNFYFYACTTTGIWQIDSADVVTALPVSYSGQPESVSIYNNKILFATLDNILHAYDLITNTQSILNQPANFVFTSTGIFTSWFDGANYFYYAEGSLNGTTAQKYFFALLSTSGIKALQSLIIGGSVFDNFSNAQLANQYIGSDANANVVWKNAPLVSMYALNSLPASGQSFGLSNVTNLLNDIPNSIYTSFVTLQAGTYDVSVSGGFDYASSTVVSDFFLGFGTEVNGTLTNGRNVIADGAVTNINFAQADTQVATGIGFIKITQPTVFFFWVYRSVATTRFDGGRIKIIKYA